MQKKTKEKLLLRVMREEGLSAEIDAERIIRAGKVRVNGEPVDKPGVQVAPSAVVQVVRGKEFVGRGALKLQHALKEFQLSPSGLVCADVGSSTGGFTEVLLRAGASKVYAIDVGYGELDYRLRVDPRVVVMERTNARNVASLPEPVGFVTIDVSFISLSKIFPVITGWMSPGAIVVALVKPQFEARREEVPEGGIVKDSLVHERVIEEVRLMASQAGFKVGAAIESPILGGDGNKEFLLSLQC